MSCQRIAVDWVLTHERTEPVIENERLETNVNVRGVDEHLHYPSFGMMKLGVHQTLQDLHEGKVSWRRVERRRFLLSVSEP